MKVCDVLPCLYQIHYSLNPLLQQELLVVDLYEMDEQIGSVMMEHSIQGPDAFKNVTKQILVDILTAKKTAQGEEISRLDFLQFRNCSETATYFSSRGQFMECHDWLIYSLSDELQYDEEIDFQIGRLNNFLVSSDGFIALYALPTIINWMGILYYYSRHHGGLVEFCSSMYDKFSKIILNLLNKKIPPQVEELQVINTASQMLAWGIDYQEASLGDIASCLADYFQRTTNRSVKKSIALQLTVGGSEHTKISSAEWAEIILSQFSDLLIGHEKMQLLAKYYSENTNKLQDEWTTLRGAIKEYVSSLKGDRVLLKYEKARLFGVISGLILNCIERGLLKLANDIISEFYEVDVKSRFTDENLYIVCNYNYGVLYSASQAMLKLNRETPKEFVEVIQQTNRYLSTTLALTGYKSFKLEKPETHGFPVKKEGKLFEELLRNHYQLGKLSEINFYVIDSMVIIPGFQHPIQPLMIKELDITLPISVSFEKPYPKRKITKVLLWCYGTRTSELETSLTKKMFESVGIQVEAINILEVTPEDFISKYGSDEYDLIWVGAHGNYDHFSPHLSRIDLHPNRELELKEIFGKAPDTGSQRMLFLNICDGATTSTLNAIYDIGLGASLCDRGQAVLSHIWMVEIDSSFIYGVLFAHFLINGDDFFKAYGNVVKSFLKGKKHISELLSPYITLEAELKNHIYKLDENINENIYYWGSGVYYQ